jgi:Heterokaryon incompatibility protein (HET)
MGILDILLKHNPNLDGRQFSSRGTQFPTPLHCAASSGWLNHAKALVEADAPVYTGPTCSPLCWAKGGSGGSGPVAIYLREKLGERGLAMIKADHERDREAASQSESVEPANRGRRPLPQLPVQPRNPGSQSLARPPPGSSSLDAPRNLLEKFLPRQPIVSCRRGLLEEEEAPRISTRIPRPSTEATLTAEHDFPAQQTRNDTPSVSTPRFGSSLDANRTARRDLPAEETNISVGAQGLCQTCAGISFKDLCRNRGYFHLSSAALLRQSAKYCKFCKIINQVLSEDRQLDQHDRDQIMIRISNGNKRHIGLCSDTPILRTLEFRLLVDCTCPGANYYFRSGRDFSKCLGSCEGIRGTEVSASIFSESGGCGSPDSVLSLTDSMIGITLTISMELDPEKDTTYDASWSIQEGTEIDPDPLSSKSLKIIQNWIENCETRHQHCKRDRSSDCESSAGSSDVPLPTRVIDVYSLDGSTIRLCKGSRQHAKYVALSHRWVSGPMPQWVTTHAVLESRQEWFSLKNLSTSVVDAVRVTRKLGVQYLWVDSLCIIQDSSEDWEVESSRMARIYANAHITLFADCGRDDDHGFIFPRKTFPSTNCGLTEGGRQFSQIQHSKVFVVEFQGCPIFLVPYKCRSFASLRQRMDLPRTRPLPSDSAFWEGPDVLGVQ